MIYNFIQNLRIVVIKYKFCSNKNNLLKYNKKLCPNIILILSLISINGNAYALEKIPVPVVTIYPGDIIREQMLTEHDLPDFNGRGAVFSERSALVGKIAKRTLLPNQPVATNAVGEQKVVTTGSMVRVIFQEGGLIITTYAAALQSGAVGDMVSVRNIESGLTVAGTIAPDGSIHVGNS